jgi:hypothetical protein
MFALIENGAVKQYPYSLNEIRFANCNTSFPDIVSDATMAEYGAMRVYFSTPPELTDTQLSEEATPIFDVDAQRWSQGWMAREMTAEELLQRNTKRDEELLQRNITQTNAVRVARNNMLKDSDWTQITDATADKTAWAVYRQALRNVTAQAGFPWTVTWPDAP